MKVRQLPPLLLGDSVFVQNQTGNSPKRWDKRGVVVESEGNDQYKVRLDGSRRVTLRNRRYLRKFQPFHTGHVISDVPENKKEYPDISCAKFESKKFNMAEKSDSPVQHSTVITGDDDVGDHRLGSQREQQHEGHSVGQGGVELSEGEVDNNVTDEHSPQPNTQRQEAQQSENTANTVPTDGSPSLRRSTRAGRGQTTRFDDFELS